jgi:hypothetical protein
MKLGTKKGRKILKQIFPICLIKGSKIKVELSTVFPGRTVKS